MKMNDDMTYCQGKGCSLRESCLRYVEGKPLSEGFHWWMQHCDPEFRDGYIKANR